MESNTEDEAPVTLSIDQPFNAEEAAILLELTPRQKSFADAILMGCTQTRAAEIAGYSGKDATLRSTASGVMKSKAVQSYLAWAKNGKSGLPDDPATVAEIERRLSEHLRGADKPASLRAAEILNRLHAARLEAEKHTVRAPKESLDALARLGEVGVAVALICARHHQLDWAPPTPVDEKRVVEQLKDQLTPTERSKLENFRQLQNNVEKNFRAAAGVSPAQGSDKGRPPHSPPGAAAGPVGSTLFKKAGLL